VTQQKLKPSAALRWAARWGSRRPAPHRPQRGANAWV